MNIKKDPVLPLNYLKYRKLHVSRADKVFTKHFTNIAQSLSPAELSLFNFLCYRINNQNVVQYSTNLLQMYQTSMQMISSEYSLMPMNQCLAISVPNSRKTFRSLCRCSLLIRLSNNLYFISPMLVHYVKAVYVNQWCDDYNFAIEALPVDHNRIIQICNNYIDKNS